MNLHVQLAQIIPKQNNSKRQHTKTHYKQSVNSQRGKRIARGKQLAPYKKISTRLPADFSAESLQARREWHNTFKVLKGKKTYNQGCSTGKVITQNSRREEEFP